MATPLPFVPCESKGFILTQIQHDLIELASALSITLPSAPEYSPLPFVPCQSEGYLLTAIQHNIAAIVGAGGGTLTGDSGTTDVTSGTNTGAIAFNKTFSVAPVVTLTVIKPGSGSGNLTVTGFTVTTTGLTYSLSANAPSSGYSINWIAEGA